jgi:ankyrin repeat protein
MINRYLAVEFGDIEMATLLYDHGADVEVPTFLEKVYPLHQAVYLSTILWKSLQQSIQNDLDMVTTLLSFNADPNAQSGCGDSPLHKAVYHGYLDIAKLLVEYGANINCQTIGGKTPLMVAVQNRRRECVDWLASLQADPNLYDYRNKSTPLLYPTF